jgi:type II secretory ATPase GspE/PulE/Tfp pilus assembly ATPase PilB-like protein
MNEAADLPPGSERPRRQAPLRPAFELKPKRFHRSVIAEGPRRLWSEEGVRILNALLVTMVERSSSLVRIDADHGAVTLRWRVDGLMRRGRTISERQARALFEALELMGAGERTLRVRLGSLSAVVDLVRAPGERDRGSLEMKLLHQAPPSLNALGLSDVNARLARRLLARPRGLILIAAPAGHGKTRALGSFARTVAPQRKLAGLVSRAAEIDLPDIAASVARGDTEMAAVIRDLTDLQADVLLVDEPAGLAAWKAAIDAAHSGALVLATLRAPFAAAAIARLVGLGIDAGDLALALQGVFAQNLVPHLCEACAVKRDARPAEKRVLAAAVNEPLALREAKGCEACGETGRQGRIAIAEVMLSDPALDKLIAERASRVDLMAAARQRGTLSLAADGVARVKAGEVTLMDLLQSVDLSAEGMPV